MRANFVAAFGVLLLSNLFVEASGGIQFKIPHVRKQPPTVDGISEDESWQSVPWNEKFHSSTDLAVAAVQSRFKAVHDNRFIYFLLELEEPALASMRTIARKQRDASFWNDDSVEIFLDPGCTKTRYYHLVINHNGFMYDALCRSADMDDRFISQGMVMNNEWDIAADVSVAKTKDSWLVEVALPLAELDLFPEMDKCWGLNITRNRFAGGQREMTSFVPIAEKFHQPEYFSSAELEKLDISSYLWFISKPVDEKVYLDQGKMMYSSTVYLRNMTGRFNIIQMKTSLVSDTGSKSETLREFGVTKDEEQKIDVVLPLAEEGENELAVTLSRRVSPDVPTKISRFTRQLHFQPVRIEFIVPSYRDNIYATQNITALKVKAYLQLPESPENMLLLELRSSDNETVYSKQELKKPSSVCLVELDAGKLPEGKHKVVAVLQSGETSYRTVRDLTKLPYQKGEVWLDEKGVTHVDGKPFFSFGWFSHPPLVKTDDYNVAQSYGAWNSEESLKKWLDDAEKSGIKVFTYPYMGKKFFESFHEASQVDIDTGKPRQQDLTAEQAAQIKWAVNKVKKHPAILAWYLADEPEGRDDSAAWYKAVYELMCEIDPYHPCIMLNQSIPAMKRYHEACDILMPDCYPNFQKQGPPKKPISEIGKFIDAGTTLKATWFAPQAFDWSFWGWPDTENSRGPTFRELRNQGYQAISHGAKGLIWYSYGGGTHYFANLHQKLGMPFLAAEMQALQTAILAPEVEGDFSTAPDDVDFSCSLREVDGYPYIFAVNTSTESFEVEFNLQNIAGDNLLVVSEGRHVQVEDGKFADRFNKYETHIYTTNYALEKLPRMETIEANIEKAEKARVKPGNLLFDNKNINITASSSQWEYACNFLTDGLTEDIGRVYWRDTTADAYPDWIEIAFPSAQSVSKIIVYSPNVEDLLFQAETDNSWQTLAEIKGNSSFRLEAAFTPVSTEKLRIRISKARGQYSQVNEIEVYQSKQ